ncbi:uncharacterized protein [Oscarella lobularis]|uniref:uncharacterized protein isoform X2 n=1 Tax=Oscarella lobularis TaxID=121494 RepID=UPI0033143B7D
MLPHGRNDSRLESWRHLPSSIFFLVLLLIVRGEGQSQSLLKSNGQKFDPMAVVYRFNGNVIDDSRFAFIVKTGSEYVTKQKLKISVADRSHNGSYTCQPRSFRESNAAVIYVITRNPAIKIDGLLNIVLYEDSSLYLTVTVFYEANSVTLRVIHNETSQVFPGSRLDEAIFTNKTVVLKLSNVSRFDEGYFYVEGRGNLLNTDSKFRSDFVKVRIIRRPNSVRISKKSEGKGYVELSFTLEPSDPKHQYDRVIYYRVEWRGSTRNVSKPNVVIDGLDSCDEFPVAVVAVGNGTESSMMSTTIQTSLDSDKSIPFFRDSADERIYAYINGRELPVCVYQNTYVCHPDFDVEIRQRNGTDTDFFLFRFNKTESHRRKNPVPIQCPVVVSWCDNNHLLCPTPNTTETTFADETHKVVSGIVVGASLAAILLILYFWRWFFWFFRCFCFCRCFWYLYRKSHPQNQQPVLPVQDPSVPKPEESTRAPFVEGDKLKAFEDADSIVCLTWEMVFRAMELDDSFIDQAKAENRTVSNVGDRCLSATSQCRRKWIKENPKKDYIYELHSALVYIERADLVEKLVRRFSCLKAKQKGEDHADSELRRNFIEGNGEVAVVDPDTVSRLSLPEHCVSDSDREIAVFNDYFGDGAHHLKEDLNKCEAKPAFLHELVHLKLIPADHNLNGKTGWGSHLVNYFSKRVKRTNDVVAIRGLLKKHYQGKGLLWIKDPRK